MIVIKNPHEWPAEAAQANFDSGPIFLARSVVHVLADLVSSCLGCLVAAALLLDVAAEALERLWAVPSSSTNLVQRDLRLTMSSRSDMHIINLYMKYQY